MRSAVFSVVSCVLLAAGSPSHGEEPVVAIGKQLAAESKLGWEVRDIDHAVLGPIRVAVQRDAVTTTTGNERILSQVFVSCQKSSGKVAIELANAPGSDPAGGLRPTEMPRLVCSRPGPGGAGDAAKSDIAAKWEVSALGDALARGLSPSELRRCFSIEVLQSIALPPGPAKGSRRIAIEIAPYGRALDSVFTACGESTAYAPVQQVPAATPPVAQATAAPRPAQGAPADAGGWRPARTIAQRRTVVRAAASIDSPELTKLGPGTRILVRQSSAPWWEARSRSGAGLRGYIREDRLVFE